MKEKAKVDFDGKRKHLTGLEVGANVYCQDFKTRRWNRKGTIIRKKRNRTYQVEIEGRKYWRNIRFLRKDPGDPADLEETNDPVADPPEGPEADRNTPKTPEVPQLRRSTRTKKRTRKSLSTF